MRFVFDVPIRGSVPFLFGAAIIYVFALLSTGLLVSARARTQGEAMQSAQMLLLPSIFLTGYIFPFSGLPRILQFVGECLPATHMIAIMRGVVLRGADAVDLLPHIAAMLLLCAILVFLSVRQLRRLAP
jgi:ABC-2 type transport system permease protein